MKDGYLPLLGQDRRAEELAKLAVSAPRDRDRPGATRIASALSGGGSGARPRRPPTAAAARARAGVACGRSRSPRWLVRAGGLGIIASILAILVFIVAEVVPLFGGATVDARRASSAARRRGRARCWPTSTARHVAALDAERHGARGPPRATARSSSRRLDSCRPTRRRAVVAAQVPPGPTLLTGADRDGRRAAHAACSGDAHFEGAASASSTPELARAGRASTSTRPATARRVYAAAAGERRRPTAAAQLADGTLVVVRQHARGERVQRRGDTSAGRAAALPVAGTPHAARPRPRAAQSVRRRRRAASCSGGRSTTAGIGAAAGRAGRRRAGHRAQPAARRPLAGRRAGRTARSASGSCVAQPDGAARS